MIGFVGQQPHDDAVGEHGNIRQCLGLGMGSTSSTSARAPSGLSHGGEGVERAVRDDECAPRLWRSLALALAGVRWTMAHMVCALRSRNPRIRSRASDLSARSPAISTSTAARRIHCLISGVTGPLANSGSRHQAAKLVIQCPAEPHTIPRAPRKLRRKAWGAKGSTAVGWNAKRGWVEAGAVIGRRERSSGAALRRPLSELSAQDANLGGGAPHHHGLGVEAALVQQATPIVELAEDVDIVGGAGAIVVSECMSAGAE